MKPAQQLLAAILAYTGDNVWQDVIYQSEHYDDKVTDAIEQDGSYKDSCVIGLDDGSILCYDDQYGWRESL